jgi:hypothetical protein
MSTRSGTLAVLMLSIASTGCIVIGSRDKFKSQTNQELVVGEFVPDAYISPNDWRMYVPFFRIDREQPPHDLVLHLYDPTYRRTSDGFDHIVLDYVAISFASGKHKTLISRDSPVAGRTFEVARGKAVYDDRGSKRFNGAIEYSESFTLTVVGACISSEGERVPFKRLDSYEYSGRDWTCWTLMQELSGV